MMAVQLKHLESLLQKNKAIVKKDEPRKMTPTVYTQEMLQSTQERLINTTEVHLPLRLERIENSSPQHKQLKTGQPIFQPYPSELVFQNFVPSHTYSLPLLLLNNDKEAHAVTVVPESSEYFNVKGPGNGRVKVAPGLTASFMVFFTPQENKDYSLRLLCVTSSERFEIPVRAIGPRAILDFKDDIRLPPCVVKASTEKNHFVSNIGKRKAKFKLRTQSPFSVTPSSGMVDVGEGIPVTVAFHPMTVGDFQEDLLLLYDTGEIVHIGLFGTSEELHMRFEPEPVELKKTYISLVSSETVSLANWSDIPLKYRWTVWPSQAKDDLLLSRENSMLRQQEEKKKENMCLPVQCEFDPTTIHHVERQESKSLSLSGITLAPAKGEIWPKTTATFNIIFKPEEAKVYQHTLYCDVTGSESPLPLRIKGEGLGPKLKLNFNIMDMKDVFIGDKDHYEVQITNKGLIDAPFRFSCPDSTFGRCFSISPKEGVVSPGFCQTVEVTFHSLTLGSFSEDLLLTVTGQPETLTLTFRGCVVVPSHHFDVLDLNFGDVAFGFAATQTCTLFNTSFVPMTFSLHVMGDGTGSPSVSSAKQVSDLSRKNWRGYAARHAHLRPAEFTVHPEAGTVDAMSNVTIKVTLCSNKGKKYELALAVDVEGVGKEVSILPINARCVVPELRVEPVCLDFGRCYLGLPYEQNVQLINTSSLPACYGVLDQETEESTTLTCGSSVPRGIVPPGSSKEILVSMTAHAVGRLQTSLRIVVFGSLYQPLEVVLSCIGQGPIVWVPITQLKFGSIPVLTDETRTLSLLNQSPIPAHFNTSMTRKNSFWRVEPSEGVLPPESQLNLKIVAHLKDMLPFLDELQVFVRDSRTHTVSLSAKGTGTTIVSDKPLGPNLDLGTHFCDTPYQYRFKLTNHGLRPHRMFWKVGGILAIPRQPVDISGRTPLPPIGCSGRRDAQRQRLSSSKEKTMISVSPACLDLKPGCSVDMVLTASSDSPKVLHERLVCDSIIGGHGIQETIMSVEVMCRFVSPKLSISSKQLNFYVKKVKGSLLPVYERLVLLNVSPLPLRLELSVTEPFSLCESPGENNSTTTKFMVVKDEGQLELWVCFDPSLCTDLVSCILDKTLKLKYLEHQQQDIVKLHAEVHLPTLQFSSTTVDFGCLPKNTAAKKTITITNCSSVPLSYHWAFQKCPKLPQIRKPEMVTTEWDQHTETEASQFSPRPKADDQGSSPNPLHVDEVFDILPIYGVLNPHDQQLMTFSFHSHENTCTEVVAQCYVEDGPTYTVPVRVETSEFSYSIESTYLDFGSVLFYCVSEVKMCVRNTGKTGFQYSIKHPSNAEETEGVDKERGALIIGQKMTAGRPLVLPAVGYIDAGSEKQLRVLYLPGIPERFEKQFHLEVPFLEPQEIILTGMGVFPIVRVNLPQNLSEEHYRDVVQQAKATLNAQGVRPEPGHEVTVDEGAEKQAEYEELLNVEVENLLVRDFILSDSYHSRQDLSKFMLPGYKLDFDLVFPGQVFSQTVTVINKGAIPVSFYTDNKHLTGTGFTPELEGVKSLDPGETQTFSIKFDFQSSNAETGQTKVILLIKLTDGPVVPIQLCADISMPEITVSKDMLLFDTVQCGMCQIQTVQLQNYQIVQCRWSMAEEVKPLKKQQQRAPAVFQMIPCSGVLLHGEQTTVHVLFSPVKGCSYRRRLVVRVSGSKQQVFITAQGDAEEPQLDFCPSVLEFAPCLPFSSESKAEVRVKNLSSFPVEFYSLEFDTQYLKEEEILRRIQEYDDNDTLLLPPRIPGEGLPAELLEYCSQLKDDELNVGMGENEIEKDGKENDEEKLEPNEAPVKRNSFRMKPGVFLVSQLTREGIGANQRQLEMTPLTRAIARHIQPVLSHDTATAYAHGAIAIIVYGAPLTDKSSMAASLARHYGAVCLSVDAVITDAIQNGVTPASLSARQLYDAAKADYDQKKTAEAAKAMKEKDGVEPAPYPESSDPDSDSFLANLEDLAAEQNEKECSQNLCTAPLKSESTTKDCSVERKMSTVSFLLPEQLFVEILTERFQFSDCDHGIVINSLDSIYTPCPSSTLQGVLKAFSNRKHIYVVNLFDSYVALKKRERQQRETEEALQNEIAEQEERHLWELDQENFDALPDEEKENVTQRHLEAIQKKKEREIDQKAKEDIERRQEEEKLKERDTRKKRRKDEKPKTLEVLQTKTSREIEQSIVDNLQCEFEKYKQIQAKVDQILQVWDRVQGSLMDSVLAEDTCPSSEEPLRKKKVNMIILKIRKKTVKTVRRVHNIIPHIMVNVTANGCHSFQEMRFYSPLPSLNTILDDLSSTPSSLRRIPPVTLSVVAFPKHREQPKVHQTCFTFLNPSWQNEEEEEKNDPEEIKHRTTPKEKAAGSKRHKRDSDYKTKEKKGKERSMSISPHKIKSKIPESLTVFRWVVPAYSEVVLKLGFYSESPGIFEQVFNFELAGSCKLYQLTCRGVCTYPSICKDYRTLFTHSKKAAQEKEDLQKTYVIKPGYFEFGPLLYSKTREKYKKIQFSENSQRLVIHNNCALEAEVQFSFQHDTQATTYLFDPPTMKLKPGQQEVMTVWAFPTTPGQIKDSLVCNIKDNPEPVLINFSCWGICPQLELETNNLNFGRILLRRIDRRRITMHNKTMLPLSWTLQGVDALGDEFMIHQEQGVIQPNSSFLLHAQFSAKKPVLVKKQLRLEVYDVEKILGILQTENIAVYAEAYDVDLKIDPATSLAFGIIRGLADAKQQLTLTNKGKYDLAFKFTFGHPDPSLANIGSMFTVSPQSGTLLAHGKAEVIVIVCRPDKEVSLEEEPILSCQVIEPNLRGGEIIAILNIKISMQAVFSRYRITPVCDIDFGPLVYGTEKTLNFTIENTGFFPINFNLTSNVLEPVKQARPGRRSRMLHRESASAKSTRSAHESRLDFHPKEPNTRETCLYLGIFSVSPCTGKLQPGSKQQINVSCVAERLGTLTQTMLIDISDRNPLDQPDGIPYRLLAEVCKPGIVVDPVSIFEEHYLCQSSSQLSSEPLFNNEGVFVVNEKTFVFNKVLVGRTAQARLKLTNKTNVSCTLNLAIKYGGTKTSQQLEVFDLPTSTLNIGSQSHTFAVVTFTPQAIRPYSAVFEATVKAIYRPKLIPMNQTLEFQLAGEGTLPTVSILRPSRVNNEGNPEMRFGRASVGQRRTLPLVLLNDGNIAAEVQIDMLDKHGVLKIQLPPESSSSSVHSSEGHLIHRTTAKLDVNEQKRFEVSFCSDQSLALQTTMTVQVMDNQYSNSSIHVTGEAVKRTVSFNNFRRSWQDGEDEVGGCYDIVHFGDCHVGRTYQESFTMTNHSSSQVVRFEWPPSEPNVTFSPQIGHLHSGCSKEVTVTFSSSQPLTLKQPIRCKICQVEFKEPIEEVADWDDRHRALKRQNSGSDESQKPESKKVTETDPEPVCSQVQGSQTELELEIRAVCDYSKFTCSCDTIHFKDTLLFQTTLHQLQIINVGSVQVDFSWQVQMDEHNKIADPIGEERRRDGRCSSLPGLPSAGSSVTSPRIGNPDLPPFSVEPRSGSINPGVTQNFNICFSPVEVAQFQGRLICSIPNMQRSDQVPCVTVSGQSLLPEVLFELDDTDYIRNTSRLLDPSTQVLELKAVGLSAPTKRFFNVMNPTRTAYLFKWRCEDAAQSSLRCLTPFGTIPPGKKMEMCFEYVAEHLETVESLWSFLIENLSLSFPFLCVAAAREPRVYLDRPRLNFGELVCGHEVEQTVYLVNAEEEPFHFSVLQSSLLSEDQQSSLSLKPMNGPVMPKNRLPLLVSFTPYSEGKFNFRLNLTVKRKLEPLLLNVKADCFIMSALVQIQEQDGNLREIFTNQEETVDFGKVCISEQGIHHFLVSNLSRSILEVSFELTGPRKKLQYLEVKPQSDAVQVGKQLQASVFFCPQSLCNLHDVKLIVKVKHGPTFTVSIKGVAVAPSVEFSFTKFDFGKCFLFSPGMSPSSQTLIIHNKDTKEVSIECQFKNTAFLEVDFQPDVLGPGAVMEVPITFYPQRTCHYSRKLTFVLNGCVTKHVDIEGQGTDLKLEVKDPQQKRVKLGSLTLGQKVNKHLVLINRSLLDISFTLALKTNTPLDSKDLSIIPAGELILESGGGSCNVEIQFSPQHCIPPFSAELQAKFASFSHPLLTIEGCCKGVEVHLDRNHVSFGAVVQHCKASTKIVMMSSGAAAARFHWQTDLPAELSIKPMKGYILPDKDVTFEMTFAPVKLSDDIRYENLSCFIEGSSPVDLTVTGSCIPASINKEGLNFACRVRSCQTQSLSVTNPSSEHCTIRPVITGEQWSAALLLTFEPNQSKTFDITYRPLTVTTDGQKHLGSVFFSFPLGRGMLFNLQGTASPPKAEDTITCELPAKTKHDQVLEVNNWLSKKQSFSVLLEVVEPEKTDPTVSLKGHESIEVPALTKKDYKLSFFAYREGDYNTKVTFRNEVTGEYLFYLIYFKVRPPGVLSTIKMETPVRRVASATVDVKNPLTTDTSFTTECKCSDIKVLPQLTLPGQTKDVLRLEYLPLHVGEATSRFTLFSSDLGHFHYNLLLKALPPPAEKMVHFQAALGTCHSIPVKFINYSPIVTTYTCKTDCPDFSLDSAVHASPGFPLGSEVMVEVRFEPHQFGEVRGQLSLASEDGGEYVFPLCGVCVLPRPQGPFSIMAGGSITIPFKNVFLKTTTFYLKVDNPCFSVKEVDSIPSKKRKNILVSFEAPPGGSAQLSWSGKLTVSSQRSKGHSEQCSWVFYLQGKLPK
ncbi:hydrocephalus-inducing protein homolog [Cyprinodon tularosa]|uniref:hydrocephalus-inducing protein homolog n=1 Tax=Cyprinodon tularosa TaxID=77115 RepID=UPI0018E22143|nr:hydrocephalus-inducing protein homolog [Cyprinodon tularosa]